MLTEDKVRKMRENQLKLLTGMTPEKDGAPGSEGYATALGFHYGRISAFSSVLGEDDSFDKMLNDIEAYQISQGIIKPKGGG